MKFEPLIGMARQAKLRRMKMECDPQCVLDLAAERDDYKRGAEVEAKLGDEARAERNQLRAERDRLLSDNASLRGSCKALGEENKRLKRENKRQGKTIAAMAAKEGE